MITLEVEESLIHSVLEHTQKTSILIFQLKDFHVSAADKQIIKCTLLTETIVKSTGVDNSLEVTATRLRIACELGGYWGYLHSETVNAIL